MSNPDPMHDDESVYEEDLEDEEIEYQFNKSVDDQVDADRGK